MFSGAILTSAGSRLQVAMWILASQVRGGPRAHNLPDYLVSSEKCDRVHSPSLPVRLTLGRGRQSCHATTLKYYYSLQLSSFPLSRDNLFEAGFNPECLLQTNDCQSQALWRCLWPSPKTLRMIMSNQQWKDLPAGCCTESGLKSLSQNEQV